MKRWMILAVLVVAITTTATIAVQYLPIDSGTPGDTPFPAPSAKTGPQPLAVVDGDLTYKFGMAAQHVEIKKDWVIKNEGKADLELSKGEIACTCTSFKFKDGKESATLKPGEETTLHLTFDTRETNGAYNKTANILTNDPLHPSLQFAADGTVKPSVVLFPPEPTINFLEIFNDKDDHYATVMLYSPDRPDVKITQMTSSRPREIAVEEHPLSEEDCKTLKIDKGRRITIDVKATMPLGLFREEVLIKTDHPKQPEVKLTLNGKMVGPISSSPQRCRLVPVHSRMGKTDELVLTVRGRRPTEFTIAHKPAHFEVAIRPSDPSSEEQKGRYRLTIKVPPGLAPGQIMDEIVLKTDHPKASELKIPVDVLIEE
jgi:hypothetical protein